MRAQRRRLEQVQVLEEALAAIAEHGLSGLTMAGLARRLGTSGGHLMYYFDSKDQLLLETLRWSENQLSARRATTVTSNLPAPERLQTFIDLYLPTGAGDPRWLLKLEVWTHSPADPETLTALTDLNTAWLNDLIALLHSGIRTSEFRPVDPEGYAVLLMAMLDGFSTQLTIGTPASTRTHLQSHLQATLLPTAPK